MERRLFWGSFGDIILLLLSTELVVAITRVQGQIKGGSDSREGPQVGVCVPGKHRYLRSTPVVLR